MTSHLPKRVLDAIVARMNPLSIWLFGSRAEGRARPGSDWDLLVVLPDDVPPDDLDAVKAWERFSDLGVPLDVVPCTQSEFDEERDEPDSLPRAAWRAHQCLYERPA